MSLKVLYLDESGNHDLNPHKVNPTYPVFVLGGVIVDRAYVRDVIEPEMRRFKVTHFGRDTVPLHTVDMGKGRGEYGFLANPTRRRQFYDELNELLASWDYQIVACVFEKIRYIEQHPNPIDPYHHGIEVLVEHFCMDIGEHDDAGIIYAEMRNPKLNQELLKAWERLRRSGTNDTRPDIIDRRIVDLVLRDKSANVSGLQLADLVITPVGRHVAKKAPTPNEIQWSVVEGKLRRSGGTYEGRGLIIRP